ncbi:unnamed protein product [Schistosoma margrebowiei]|uniref:Uncharacterized protein n=1 Tax=Schistosoma margrebowiei TaxID=48269 RepID=A0A3P8BT17_9TREM|nr:unnamed protein product [Schistosoma margrebowiei]
MRQYESPSNNQLNGTRHYISTSLTMRRHLTVWIGEHYGNFFDTVEFLRRLSIRQHVLLTSFLCVSLKRLLLFYITMYL